MTDLTQIDDNRFMERAMVMADLAAHAGEVPIGAVVVYQGEVIAEGYNQTITQLDPSAHAEFVAIRKAALVLGNYRLVGCTLYVTIEPCTMCTGLLVHSRIDRLVFGAKEAKAGAICSATQINEQPHFNHQFQVQSGVLEAECADKMSTFFRTRRERMKRLRQQAQSPKER